MDSDGNQTGLSYASGTSAVALIGETIGDNFDRAAARDYKNGTANL
jgi:hypothetical protein